MCCCGWLQGLPTIRAYCAGSRFASDFLKVLDANGAWWFAYIATSRWIAYRLDAIAAIMLTAGAMLAMAVHDKVSREGCSMHGSSHCFALAILLLGQCGVVLCADLPQACGSRPGPCSQPHLQHAGMLLLPLHSVLPVRRLS